MGHFPAPARGNLLRPQAPSGHPPLIFISWLWGEGSTSGRGHAGWLFLFWPVLPACPLLPALRGGVSSPGPNGEQRGRAGAGRRRDPGWGAEGGQGQGRGTWRGAGATRRGGKARSICFKEGKKGQLTVVKRRKGNIVEIGARNQAKKRKGQNWLVQTLRDAKSNENVRKVKSSSYKSLDYSEPTHRVPMTHPERGNNLPCILWTTTHTHHLQARSAQRGLIQSPHVSVCWFILHFF